MAIGRRSLRLFVGCLTVLLAAAPAGAQPSTAPVAEIDVDFVRWVGGRHLLRLRIQDAEGRPIPRVSDVLVEHDGRAIDDVSVSSWMGSAGPLQISVLVDAPLAWQGRAHLAALLDSISRSAARDERLRVGLVGRDLQTTSLPLRQGPGAQEWLSDRVRPGSEVRLWDALHEEVRSARAGNGVVVLITRGSDDGSGKRVLHALAAATSGDVPVPILVYLVGAGREAERLTRLSGHVGGTLRRLSGMSEVPAAVSMGLRQMRGAYELSFEDPEWDRGQAEHALTLTVQHGGARRWVRHAYSTADVLPPPWWRSGLVWAIAGSVLLLGAATWWYLRPNRLCALVVDGGEEHGCRYDVYDVPLTIGAAAGNDIILGQARISRSHIVLEKRGRSVELVDLNSENGTYVNGDRVSRRQLAAGDRISLAGSIEFIYRS